VHRKHETTESAEQDDGRRPWSDWSCIFGAAIASLRVMDDHEHVYATPRAELSRRREELAPEIEKAFQGFSRTVFAAGALDAKTKQLIAVAAAHVTQCPYCIRAHTKAALRAGVLERELMEAIWIAAEMRAGAAFAHSVIALEVMKDAEKKAT
jgi:AhpD family alkylhydroperoxidase